MNILTPEQFRAKYCKNVKPQKSWTSLDFVPLHNGARWGDCDEMPSVNELIKPRTFKFTIEKPKPIVIPQKTVAGEYVAKPIISLEEGEIDESEEPVEVKVIPIVTPKITVTWGYVATKTISLKILEEGEIDETAVEVIPIVTPKKTVTWGGVVTKTIVILEGNDEIEEIIKKVFKLRIDPDIVKPKILEEGEIDEDEPEQVLYPQIEFSIDDDERPPAIWRPAEHGYCLFCDFKIHSNPPPHFTPQQRKHCCGWCETSLGRGHGQHCQRCT